MSKKKDWSTLNDADEDNSVQETENRSDPDEELLLEDVTETDSSTAEKTVDASELQAALNKAQENWDKFVRLQAEMANVQRRAQQDLSNAHKYAIDKFSQDLIPVVDSLEQALSTSNVNDAAMKSMREGIELTLKLFLKVLEKYHIKQLNPEGEMFDPNFHEAMAAQPADAPNGTILKVYQKGYLLHDRLVRPARVVVVKN